MKRFTKRIILSILALLIVYQLINKVFAKTVDYSNPAEVEQILISNCEHNHCLIPISWYAPKSGWMSPMVAGFIDEAYATGVSVKDISVFVANYFMHAESRQQFHNQIAGIVENPEMVYNVLKISIKDALIDLSGSNGSTAGEYQAGKTAAMILTTVIGVGEVSALIKTTKLGESIGKLSSYAKKIVRIENICPPCAVIFKQAKNLRTNLLSGENLVKVKLLLKEEFEASGKTWDVFIKQYEAHHVIPVDMLQISNEITFFYKNGGKFDFNSFSNGIFLKKTALGGSHSIHPSYNDKVYEILEKRLSKIVSSNLDTRLKIGLMEKELTVITTELKDRIILKSAGQNFKINNLFE